MTIAVALIVLKEVVGQRWVHMCLSTNFSYPNHSWIFIFSVLPVEVNVRVGEVVVAPYALMVYATNIVNMYLWNKKWF